MQEQKPIFDEKMKNVLFWIGLALFVLVLVLAIAWGLWQYLIVPAPLVAPKLLDAQEEGRKKQEAHKEKMRIAEIDRREKLKKDIEQIDKEQEARKSKGKEAAQGDPEKQRKRILDNLED